MDRAEETHAEQRVREQEVDGAQCDGPSGEIYKTSPKGWSEEEERGTGFWLGTDGPRALGRRTGPLRAGPWGSPFQASLTSILFYFSAVLLGWTLEHWTAVVIS